MNWSYAARSLAMFVASIFFVVLLTLFESSFSGMPVPVERIVSALFLVLPGVIGIVLGIMSLSRKESNRRMAILGIALNGLFALFHAFVLGFAG